MEKMNEVDTREKEKEREKINAGNSIAFQPLTE